MISFRKLFTSVLLTVLLCSMIGFAADAPAKQPLRILYIGKTPIQPKTASPGNPYDPDRPADFEKFLSSEFTSVKMVVEKEFTPALANAADVIVVDAVVPGGIPTEVRRPMVIMGGNGVFAIRNTGTKIDWL
jgi:hypothetical protein